MATKHDSCVCHPLLVPNLIERRAYQENIAIRASKRNSLVVLPTALGKTTIAILVAIQRLSQYPWGKILVLAPTRPLVMQHFKSFRKFLQLPEDKLVLLTGRVTGTRRAYEYHRGQIIFSTPQVIANDLELGRSSLGGVILVVFDEAHKARKSYAYTKIAENYMSHNADPRILGLTASPGKDADRIRTLLSKLYIEQVEFRVEDSLDVRDYVNPIDLDIQKVSLPLLYWEAIRLMDDLLAEWCEVFYRHNLLERKSYYSKMAFLELAEQISVLMSNASNPFQKLNILKWFTFAGSCISLIHGRELLITQGVQVFSHFAKKIAEKAEKGKRSAQNLLANDKFQVVLDLANKGSLPDHPKIELLQQIVKDQLDANPTSRIIIFAQYRHTVKLIVERLASICTPERFVGQASNIEDPGMCQETQQEIISQFRQASCNVLVATSVAEEGLDIPEVDLVIFFEAVPSEIRLIQRRGRTGRKSPGKCIILATADTFDERFLEISFKREEKMIETLRDIVQTEDLPQYPRTPLQPPTEQKNLDYVDFAALDRQKRKEQDFIKYDNLLKLLNSGPYPPNSQENPLLKTLTKKVELMKIKNQITEKFRSKEGKFLALTLASASKEGISHEELLELSKFEEFDLEKIERELAHAVQNKIFEVLPGKMYRITSVTMKK